MISVVRLSSFFNGRVVANVLQATGASLLIVTLASGIPHNRHFTGEFMVTFYLTLAQHFHFLSLSTVTQYSTP